MQRRPCNDDLKGDLVQRGRPPRSIGLAIRALSSARLCGGARDGLARLLDSSDQQLLVVDHYRRCLRVLGHTKLGWRTRAYDSKLSQASAQAKRVQNYSLVAINDERIRTRFSGRKPPPGNVCGRAVAASAARDRAVAYARWEAAPLSVRAASGPTSLAHPLQRRPRLGPRSAPTPQLGQRHVQVRVKLFRCNLRGIVDVDFVSDAGPEAFVAAR
jgi:hypothetical protein